VRERLGLHAEHRLQVGELPIQLLQLTL